MGLKVFGELLDSHQADLRCQLERQHDLDGPSPLPIKTKTRTVKATVK
jgi:hypothetical protein